jgi:hypothetical protein
MCKEKQYGKPLEGGMGFLRMRSQLGQGAVPKRVP